MRTHYTLLSIVVIFNLFFQGTAYSDGIAQPSIQSSAQYTRLQIPISGGTTFSVINGASEITLTLDRIRPESIALLSKMGDNRIANISVTKKGLDQAEATIRFQSSEMDSFAYIQGTQLVVDLWQREGVGHSNNLSHTVEADSRTNKKLRAQKAGESKLAHHKEKPARRIASVNEAHGEAKSEDAKKEGTKIVVKPLSRDTDLFQRFELPIPEYAAFKGKHMAIPVKQNIDSIWKFEPVAHSDDEEVKKFNFAKRLFEKKRYGLTIKSIEIISKENPKSKSADEMELLQAISMYHLGEDSQAPALTDKAEKMLESLSTKQGSDGLLLPFHRNIRLFFAQKSYSRGEWLSAISNFEYVSSVMDPNDEDFALLQYILADCYIKVNQPRRAERLYRYIAEKHSKSILAKESVYRVSDLLSKEKNYQRAIDEGQNALAKYPEYEKSRPEVIFNIAEAYFWLNNYSDAEKYFKRFIEKSSANTFASLAYVRLGEISELTKGNLVDAKNYYLKAKNGYPFSAGDLVATIRLSRINLAEEKDPGFILSTLKEILKDKSLESDLRYAAELVMIRYLNMTGNADEALAASSSGMAKTEGTPYEAYKLAFVDSMYAKWKETTDAKEYADALALYNKEKKWIDLYGPETFKTAAEMYKGLKLYSTSNEMMERYVAEVGKKSGRNIASVAASEFRDSKIENSFSKGQYADVLNNLEGRNDVRSVYMRMKSLYHLGRKKECYKELESLTSKIKANAKALDDQTLDEIAGVVAERDEQSKEFTRMEKDLNILSQANKVESEKISYLLADSIWYQRNHQRAIVAYEEAIKKFPKSTRRERSEYNIGMSFLSIGKREEAVRRLTDLQAKSKTVWGESASRELDLIKWEQDYSSVLRTSPPNGLGITN